jgi:hypothetical protein
VDIPFLKQGGRYVLPVTIRRTFWTLCSLRRMDGSIPGTAYGLRATRQHTFAYVIAFHGDGKEWGLGRVAPAKLGACASRGLAQAFSQL